MKKKHTVNNKYVHTSTSYFAISSLASLIVLTACSSYEMQTGSVRQYNFNPFSLSGSLLEGLQIKVTYPNKSSLMLIFGKMGELDYQNKKNYCFLYYLLFCDVSTIMRTSNMYDCFIQLMALEKKKKVINFP